MLKKGLHRFFIEGFKPSPAYQVTEKKLLHQCVKVLRLNQNDCIVFFDGKTYKDFVYQIQKIGAKNIQLQFIEEIKKNPIPRSICIYQSLPNKLSKIELIVQKTTEIGVKKIVFFGSDFSQNILHINDKKKERVQKIAIEACEQSQNNIIPELVFEKSIDFSTMPKEDTLWFHTQEGGTLLSLFDCSTDIGEKISLLIGPEGGFSEKEIQSLKRENIKQIFLGNSVLRTETVPIVVAFFLQHIS